MAIAYQTAAGQARLWNGSGGCAWVETQDVLDQMFQPFEDMLVGAVTAGGGGRVLDVGCGTGATTIAVARRLGSAGFCTGIDISEPMIASARARAERELLAAPFICADAETHTFEPAAFDVIISRFGVMFFDDPVRAFANLRTAAARSAGLRFVAWRDPAENLFMTAAERAAAPLVPDLPRRRPDAPGQFAFADRDRMKHVLEKSGWKDIDIRAIDVVCAFPERDLLRYLTNLGPLGVALQAMSRQAATHVVQKIRSAFDPHVYGAEVRYTAACWMASARS